MNIVNKLAVGRFVFAGLVLGAVCVRGQEGGEKLLSNDAIARMQSSKDAWSGLGDANVLLQEGKEPGGFAFHTAYDDEAPYIVVELKKTAKLTRLFIQNRTDSYEERAKNLTIWASEDFITWKPVWSAGGKAEKEWTIALNGVKAKYLRLGLPGKGVLHLNKVRVYGNDL